MEKLQNNSYEYYTLYTNAIVCSKVSVRKIDEIIYCQDGKKYYDPSEAELLAYANPNYREQNEYVDEMLKLLVDMKVNRLVAESFLSKLVWYIRIEESVQAEYDLLENYGIEFKNTKQEDEFCKILQNLNNNTRKWANCGYTPTEMIKILR